MVVRPQPAYSLRPRRPPPRLLRLARLRLGSHSTGDNVAVQDGPDPPSVSRRTHARSRMRITLSVCRSGLAEDGEVLSEINSDMELN